MLIIPIIASRAADEIQITEEGSITKLGYPSAFVKNAPAFDPEVELAQVEKEEINVYLGGSRQYAGSAESKKYAPRKPSNVERQTKKPYRTLALLDP